jgi:hypothetical protein
MDDLVVKSNDDLALLSQDTGGEWIQGLEDDLIRPKFVRLISFSSRALIKGSDSFIEGLASGDYAIGTDKRILGKTMRIVTCGTKKDFVELDGDPPEGKFIARHTPQEFAQIKLVLTQDENNPGKWRDSGGKCFVETMTLFILDLDHLELGGLCMSFTSSGIKAWRDIVGRTAQAKIKGSDGKTVPLAPWACVWTLGSRTETPKIGNPYLLPAIEGNFAILEDDKRKIAKEAFDQVNAAIKAGRVKVEEAE